MIRDMETTTANHCPEPCYGVSVLHPEHGITAASVVLDGDTYVKRGAFLCTDTREWADTFNALGGLRASIYPAWRFADAPDVIADIAGTEAAVAFALNTL